MSLDFIKQALSEANGNPSSMRIMVFYCVLLFATVTGLGFIKVLFSDTSIIIEYVMALLAFLAAALGIKSYQKGKETAASEEQADEEDVTKLASQDKGKQ